MPVIEFRKSRGEEEPEPFYDDMGGDGVRDYWQHKNTQMIDGKPAAIFEA